MSEYTKGKLTVGGIDKDILFLESASGGILRFVGETNGVHATDDARRLVACWNACAGISTEELEHGVLTLARQQKD